MNLLISAVLVAAIIGTAMRLRSLLKDLRAPHVSAWDEDSFQADYGTTSEERIAEERPGVKV